MNRKLLLIALSAALTGSAWAQTAGSSPSTPPPGGTSSAPQLFPDLSKILTPDEQTKLMTDHNSVIQANPDLGDQEKELIVNIAAAQNSGGPPDPDLIAQAMDLQKKLHDAILKFDPTIKPILDKVDAATKKLTSGLTASGVTLPTPPATGTP
jgi:hypothetical protein